MEPTELSRLVGDRLDECGCPRFVTGSPKHLRDIASMIAVQGEEALDWAYLDEWAMRLGVTTELARVRRGP